MTFLVEDHQVTLEFSNHFRAAKSRLFEINNSRGKNKEQKISEIIKLTTNTLEYAQDALKVLEDWKYTGDDRVRYQALKCSLEATILACYADVTSCKAETFRRRISTVIREDSILI